MNENARLWVEALRSGRFDQTQGVLHRENDGYCCLGVACEVFREVTRQGRWQRTGNEIVEFVVGEFGDASDTELPRAVMVWLGLAEPDGTYDDESLINLNDTGASFEKIADIIETERGLFYES